MAGRLPFHQLSSRMPRWTSLLCSRASATAGVPVIPRVSEGASITLRYSSHGTAAYPGRVVPRNLEVLGNAVRHSNLLSSSTAAETSCPSIRMTKPAFVDSATARGAKQYLSFSVYPKHNISKLSWEATRAVMKARCAAEEAAFKAKIEALEAEDKAWLEKMAAKEAAFEKYIRRMVWLISFNCLSYISLYDSWYS